MIHVAKAMRRHGNCKDIFEESKPSNYAFINGQNLPVAGPQFITLVKLPQNVPQGRVKTIKHNQSDSGGLVASRKHSK